MKKEFNLPFFYWFYESIHTFENEELLAEDYWVDVDTIIDNFDYKKYEQEYSKDYVWIMYSEYELLFKELWFSKFEFVELVAPREYNFKTDIIYVTTEINEQLFFDEILKFVRTETDSFTTFIRNKFESYPWFISSYSDNSIDWYKKLELKDINLLDNIELSALIQFAILMYTENNVESYNNIADELHYKTISDLYWDEYLNIDEIKKIKD